MRIVVGRSAQVGEVESYLNSWVGKGIVDDKYMSASYPASFGFGLWLWDFF